MEKPTQTAAAPARQLSPGRVRWFICGLLFLATTLNYMDRQVLGILAVPLQREIGWSESDYGLIVASFQTAYAIGLIGFGRFIDVIGIRWGYALALGVWSVAAALHGAVNSVVGFAAARFGLGLGESGNFPAAVKTVSEWFPRKERALAMGLFNCGSNVGAIITPLVVPWLALTFGWRSAFIVVGALGLLWLVLWWTTYHPVSSHPWLSAGERAYIESDAPDAGSQHVSWRELLRYRETWGLMLARFITDPVWWFYLYWAPKYLQNTFHMPLDRVGIPLVVIYLAADLGSVGAGWLSSSLIKRNWTVNRARKLAIAICATLVVPLALAWHAPDAWTVIACLAMAAAAHQGWSANMFAAHTDIFPKGAVSSVAGLTGFAGAVGGVIAASGIGFLLEKTHSYEPMFLWAGCAYFTALGLIHITSPRLAPAAARAQEK